MKCGEGITKCHLSIPNSRFQIPDSKFQIPDYINLESGLEDLKFQIVRSEIRKSLIWNLESGIWNYCVDGFINFDSQRKEKIMRYYRFEDLPVWNSAIDLAAHVYDFTDKVQFRRRRSLKDQIERAAVSV